MFLRERLSSAGWPAFALLAFLLGAALGASIGPVTAGRDNGFAPMVRESPPRMAYPADVLQVVDGDTFEARVQLWPGLSITTRVRLRGIDAPELKARCAEERELALAARTALQAMLAGGAVGIQNVTLDKYGGRVLADVSTNVTSDVSQAMLGTGFARRYDGGRRDGWCDR